MSFELLGVAHYCTASPGWFGICTVLYCTVVTVLVSFGIAVLCVIVFRSRPSRDVQCVNTRCGKRTVGTESWRARSALAEYSNV